MRRFMKFAALAALPAVTLIGTATMASAKTAANASTSVDTSFIPVLDTPDYVSSTPNCTPGVTTHTDYKWVPDVTSAGPTMWTVNPASAGTGATFQWKGVPVAYHRDGTKTQQATDTLCGVTAPQFSNGTVSCSVTVPYTQGLDTFLYGVNGYSQENPITGPATVTAGLDGAAGTAPQFWIGYSAKPGYVLGGAPGTTHVDFYNGDYVPDCTLPA
jgi:hypothetical protein